MELFDPKSKGRWATSVLLEEALCPWPWRGRLDLVPETSKGSLPGRSHLFICYTASKALFVAQQHSQSSPQQSDAAACGVLLRMVHFHPTRGFNDVTDECLESKHPYAQSTRFIRTFYPSVRVSCVVL